MVHQSFMLSLLRYSVTPLRRYKVVSSSKSTGSDELNDLNSYREKNRAWTSRLQTGSPDVLL
jgi:hypothetical protein